MLDGLIYCPVATGEFIREMNFLKKIPLVIAGRRKVLEGVPHVTTDDENAGYIATKYLLKLGRKAIGYLAGFWGTPPVRTVEELLMAAHSEMSGSFSTLDRLRGYEKALIESGNKVEAVKLVFSSFDSEGGYTAAQEIFSRLESIDALIVPNCYVAKGVLQFCREQGIRVPEDISLISMDDLRTGDLLTIPTTSIIHNMYQVGVESVESINRVLERGKADDRLIGVMLKIRQSTMRKV
jgi:DNA-binding LacI/PurR family transcriptional regulator